jgi:hypothetical protein
VGCYGAEIGGVEMISQWLLVMLVSGYLTSPGDEIYKTEQSCHLALRAMVSQMKPSDIEARKPRCIRQVYEAIKPQVVEDYPGEFRK